MVDLDGFGKILVLGMPLFEPDLKHSETLLATRKFSAPPIVFLLEDQQNHQLSSTWLVQTI